MTMLAAALLAAAMAAGAERPALMPWPRSIEPGEGELAVGPGFRVRVSGTCGALVESAARRAEARLARQTGLVAPDPVATTGLALELRCASRGQQRPRLGMDESYALEVSAAGATLSAAEPWGILRGIETFLQLVTPGAASAFRVPAVSIRDAPRFPWRGLLLDSGRHFMAVDTVKRTLDGMAAVKLNVLHWHLTEDQGFRVESRRYPALHRLGSDGLYYTRAQIQELVAFAAERGIRVVPEFDMPGHTTSWFVGHPELATSPGPYAIERRWGIFRPAMDPSKEEVYRLLDGFLGEMAELFPDEFLHIGGDEVEGHDWEASERLAAFKRQKGLAGNHDLQAHFNRRLARIVTGHGKQMVGWDEIQHSELPREAVIHSWRGPEGLAKAAQQGFRGILSNGYYIDLAWTAERHYAVDPHAGAVEALSQAERARVLGGEATMWSEYVSNETVDSRIWPRAAAIAERLWSPREVRDVGDMYARLATVSRWLEWQGLTHRSGPARMLERLAGARAGELRRLAEVVEPVEDYRRGGTSLHTQQTPLNRLVDAVPPESDAARELAALVAAFLADPARRQGIEIVRQRLRSWQRLDADLRSLLDSRERLRELVPLAEEASGLANAGLEALELLAPGRAAPEGWSQRQAAFLASRPPSPAHALDVAYRPSVVALIEACAGGTP